MWSRQPLKCETDSWGFKNYVNYDVCVCGIVDMVLAAEKYSGFDTTEVRAGIEEKRVWLRDNEPEYYADAARYYEMPYWTLVNMAKEAGATWALRKTAMVDLDIFEKYLEEHEIHPDGYPKLQIGKRGSQLLHLFIIVIML